jgi:Zn-dependent M28 family amino/carboxypeptidase
MLAIFLIVSVASFVVIRTNYAQARPQEFDGDRAFQDVEYQVSLGARIPDSPAHEKVREWIAAELEQAGWSAEIQPAEKMGHAIYNIVGKRGQGQPLIIIGAHYDSRLISDQDPDPEKRNQPVPGANDGASGVAILLELARTLPDLDAEIWLVFFDAEDNGNIPGWDWILGSTAFVEQLAQNPDAVVILDMLGDADLNIHFERSSDAVISEAIWQQAADLGYGDVFIPTPKYNILDDHLPFLRAGIPAVDIIDFDYPYWHTTADTPDKVSADSLKAVGDTIRAWLLSKQ